MKRLLVFFRTIFDCMKMPPNPRATQINLDSTMARAMRVARLKQDLTTADLARQAEIAEADLLLLEQGELRPTPEQLLRLCDILGLGAEDLFR